jgi:hypothetical protein
MILDSLGILLALVMVLLKKVRVICGFILELTGTMLDKLEEIREFKELKDFRV